MRIELSSDANAMSIQFFPRIGPDESVHLLASHQGALLFVACRWPFLTIRSSNLFR